MSGGVKIKKSAYQPKPRKRQYYSVFVKRELHVRVAECPLCGDIVYSRCRHDMRWCTCNNVYVDGGIDYFKYGWKAKKPTNWVLRIKANKTDLYDDWNCSADKYGLITLEEYKFFGQFGRRYNDKSDES